MLIIAGTGRNSGKTTLACTILAQAGRSDMVAIKISPHSHDPLPSSFPMHRGSGFGIYREYSTGGSKDTERMLDAGAAEAYYIEAGDESIMEAFGWLHAKIQSGVPVVCESPALRRYVEPGLFLVADSNFVQKRKDLSDISELADIVIKYGSGQPSPGLVLFCNGRWFIGR